MARTWPVCIVVSVRVSYVLRLDQAELANGHLHGEVEEVATGHIGALGGVEDLVSFCTGNYGGGNGASRFPTREGGAPK